MKDVFAHRSEFWRTGTSGARYKYVETIDQRQMYYDLDYAIKTQSVFTFMLMNVVTSHAIHFNINAEFRNEQEEPF